MWNRDHTFRKCCCRVAFYKPVPSPPTSNPSARPSASPYNLARLSTSRFPWGGPSQLLSFQREEAPSPNPVPTIQHDAEVFLRLLRRSQAHKPSMTVSSQGRNLLAAQSHQILAMPYPFDSSTPESSRLYWTAPPYHQHTLCVFVCVCPSPRTPSPTCPNPSRLSETAQVSAPPRNLLSPHISLRLFSSELTYLSTEETARQVQPKLLTHRLVSYIRGCCFKLPHLGVVSL